MSPFDSPVDLNRMVWEFSTDVRDGLREGMTKDELLSRLDRLHWDIICKTTYPDMIAKAFEFIHLVGELGSSCVYYMHGRDGKVLYIGQTTRPVHRMREHLRQTPWISEVTYVDFQYVPDKDRVSTEGYDIKAFRPKYNVVGNGGNK